MGDVVEEVAWEGQILAYVIRAQTAPDATTFVTPPDLGLQAGFIVYAAGGEVRPHTHRPVDRHLVTTCEVLVVKQGRCVVDLYNNDRVLVASRELGPGDVIILTGGGHGCRILEDTVLLEVKQGPYVGRHEKVPLA